LVTVSYRMIKRHLKYLFEVRMTQNRRRAAITAELVERTGIDEAMIVRLVCAFYARVREDALLAPVFAERIGDWEPHLERMCAFWSSVALLTGRYHGRPTEKHEPLPVDARHFDRWLELFEETAREQCPPSAAQHFIERAQWIAQSLELAVASRSGRMLRKGQRLRRPDSEVHLPDAVLEEERPA
jgi:hemoglobin